jgi:hypothetical protein
LRGERAVLQTHGCVDGQISDHPHDGSAAAESEESHQYLQSLGFEIADVRQASLSSVRIPGTPTLLLLDDQGIVKNVWAGKLTDKGEEQVLQTLGLTPAQ